MPAYRSAALDIRHAVSRVWLEQRALAGEPLVSPVLVLSKITGAIARRIGKPEIAHQALAAILRIPTLRLVEINRQLALRHSSLPTTSYEAQTPSMWRWHKNYIYLLSH